MRMRGWGLSVSREEGRGRGRGERIKEGESSDERDGCMVYEDLSQF